MDDDNSVGVADAFADLMSGAMENAAPEADEAPYGWTTDRDGTRRPKKSPGRPRRSPSVDELKASAPSTPVAEDAGDAKTPADRAPSPRTGRGKGGTLRITRGHTQGPAESVPYRPGVITSGINRLYRQAGKIIRAGDKEIGQAFIEASRNTAADGEPDDSVGAAWDQLARTNPRVRAFAMKLLAGGAMTQLFMAHAPILLAIAMKPMILRLLPFSRLIESMAEPDDDTPAGRGGLPGGMTMDDLSEMQALAEEQAKAMGLRIPPEVSQQMAQMAAGMGLVPNLAPVPPVSRETSQPFARRQPRRPAARAKRTG